ncbi:MAG: substrate-binding domain-containing protein [Lachnospiraceae bacterium]|nr:substrate-binding domain-containing protein [Lachnospiraceae bacterium]
MKKVLKGTGIILLLAMIILPAFGGCAKKTEGGGKQLRVGVVLYKNDDPFINSLTANLKSDFESFESDELRIVTTVRNGESNQRTEDAVVEEIIDAGCDILCVNLVDRTVPGNIIDAAKSADIPVIFFNREPVREDLMSWEKLY